MIFHIKKSRKMNARKWMNVKKKKNWQQRRQNKKKKNTGTYEKTES